MSIELNIRAEGWVERGEEVNIDGYLGNSCLIANLTRRKSRDKTIQVASTTSSVHSSTRQ